jgi:predicted Zn-dependent protease
MRRLEDTAERILVSVRAEVEAEVRVASNRHGLTRFANSFIHQHVGEETAEAELRVAVDGRVSSSTTSNLADESLDRFVADAVDAARLQPVDPHWPGVAPPSEIPEIDHFDPETADALPAERAEMVRSFIAADTGLRAAGFADTQAISFAFANSAGHQAQGRTTRATIDGIQQTDTSAGSAHQTSLGLADLDAAAAGGIAAELAHRSAAFVDLEPGRYQVVLSPECVATIAVFLAAYGFNAQAHLDGSSFVRLDEPQFSPLLTIVDDPLRPDAIGLGFDNEGTPKRPLTLVEQGITRSLVHDRRTAHRAGVTSTGHALGASGFGPVPVNVVVTPGSATADELAAGVERGLLITEFNYCRILDPRTQVVTGLTRNGTFLIEDGAIAGGVGNLRFTQSFLEALSEENLIKVGGDARYANSEFGPGLIVAPSLHLASWTFTGGAAG